MRRVTVLLAALLAAGCAQDAAAPEPAPVATTTSAAPTPTGTVGVALPVRVPKVEVPLPTVEQVEEWIGPGPGGADPTPLQQVLHQLRYDTVFQARRPAAATARCAGDRLVLTDGAENRCTVVYAGRPVPWTVTVSTDGIDNSGAVDVVEYTSETDRFVVRADVIAAAVWWRADGTEVRCTRLPAVRVLPAGRTGDRCQYLDAERTWRTFQVAVDEDGDVRLDPV